MKRILLAALLAAVAATVPAARAQAAAVPSESTQRVPSARPPATLNLPRQGALTISAANALTSHLDDWPQLSRYAAANAELAAPAPGDKPRIVFYGDSLTDAWHNIGKSFGPGSYINRGISGQTTPQMVVRFRQDVVNLHPAVVVILAGTNDIAGNTGAYSVAATHDNFLSMLDLAEANHIRVVVSSVLPASAFPWNPGQHPAQDVRDLNAWLKDVCAQRGLVYLDYYPALANDIGGMKDGLSRDGVHPTAAGYAIMEPLAEKAIAQALEQK
jgi:lysophospholipase L1-like esterase